MTQGHTDITGLIERSREGDKAAEQELFELVYEQLRSLARSRRFVGADGDTLQPTALANEAYLTLARQFPLPPTDQPESRATFFRSVAQAMRLILRNHWRARNAEQRGGGRPVFELRDDDAPTDGRRGFDSIDYVALDEALTKLEQQHPQWAEIVMHRHFAGRTLEETATLMNVGLSKVKAEWRMARGWLRREMGATD